MPSITAPGILLRPFQDADAPLFVQAARESCDTVGRWLPWCHADYTETDALAWFSVCRAGAKSGSAYEFGVFSEDGSLFFGGAGLNQISKQHAYCNLGYWVRQSRQRMGIATRCVKALSEHGFEAFRLNRIEIVVAVGNEPSEAVAVKSAAILECVARNRLLIRGVPVAARVFSMIPQHKVVVDPS